MPLWIIYHPPTTFQDEETKAALAKDITSSNPPCSIQSTHLPFHPCSIRPLSTLPYPNSVLILTPLVYTSVSLPAFYVNVLYIPVPSSSLFIGGVSRPSAPTSSTPKGPDPSKPWIRITIQNIARKIPNKEVGDRFLERVDRALEPWIKDKGELMILLRLLIMFLLEDPMRVLGREGGAHSVFFRDTAASLTRQIKANMWLSRVRVGV
jgi:hypothetical protein